MILVDSNVPMYLVGAEHPLKLASSHVLERAIAGHERLVTDAEVLPRFSTATRPSTVATPSSQHSTHCSA